VAGAENLTGQLALVHSTQKMVPMFDRTACAHKSFCLSEGLPRWLAGEPFERDSPHGGNASRRKIRLGFLDIASL